MFVIITGCEEEFLTPKALIEWVEDANNGLIVTKKIEEYQYSAIYQPTNYLIAKAVKKEKITSEEIEKYAKDYENMHHFTLRIALQESKGDLIKQISIDQMDYQENVNYFSFDMQKDIVLVENNDTLPCRLYHFERMYGSVPYCNVNLAFEKNNQSPLITNKTLIINDQKLGVGKVKLTIEGKNISVVPQLKTA